MANFIPKISWNDYSGGNTYTFPNMASGDPLGDKFTPDWDVVVANKGKRWVQYNFTERDFSVHFIFLAESDKTALLAFFDVWGKLGKTFRYYEHSDLGTFWNVQLLDGVFEFKAIFADGAGGMVYEFTLNLRNFYP